MFDTAEFFTYSGAVILSALLLWLYLEIFLRNVCSEGELGREAHKSAFSTRHMQLVLPSTVHYETSNSGDHVCGVDQSNLS